MRVRRQRNRASRRPDPVGNINQGRHEPHGGHRPAVIAAVNANSVPVCSGLHSAGDPSGYLVQYV